MFLRHYPKQLFPGRRVNMRSFITQGMAHTSEEIHGRVPLRQNAVRTNCSHPLTPPTGSNFQCPVSTPSTEDETALLSAISFCLLSFRYFLMPSHCQGPGIPALCGRQLRWPVAGVQTFVSGKAITKPYSWAIQDSALPLRLLCWTAVS